MVDRLAPVTDRIDQYATALRLTGQSAVVFENTVGPILKAEVATAAAAAFGTDLKPWKNKGVRAGFGYDREEIPNGCRIKIKLRPAGVWAFGEHGAKAHRIGGAKGRGKRARVVYVKSASHAHPVRGVDHPGSAGKGAIRYVFKLVRRAQMQAVRAGIGAVIEDVRRRG